jgi:hypothetical protein
VLEIILEILAAVNVMNLVSYVVMPQGVEADFASIFGLEVNATYFKCGLKKRFILEESNFCCRCLSNT